jgi:hypothetical protein
MSLECLLLDSESLKTIQMFEIPGNFEGSFIKCPQLSHIQLEKCLDFNDKALQPLLLPSLHTVIFSELPRYQKLSTIITFRISAQSLVAVSRICQNISSIRCNYSPWVVEFSSDSPTLTNLNLEHCKALETIHLKVKLVNQFKF